MAKVIDSLFWRERRDKELIYHVKTTQFGEKITNNTDFCIQVISLDLSLEELQHHAKALAPKLTN